MSYNGFKYTYILKLLIFGLLLIHKKINGQQTVCVGSKITYWVDKDKIIQDNELYSWHVNSSHFTGSIMVLNATGNQIEIDWGNSKVGKYLLEVSKSNYCGTVKTELEILIEEKISLNMPTLYYLCPDIEELTIHAISGFASYTWLNENNEVIGNGQTIKLSNQGHYLLKVSNGECLGYLNFEVVPYQFPTIQITNQNVHSIYIQMNQNNEDFLYQLLDKNYNIIKDWQSKPVFENIGKGDYIVKIKSIQSDCITDLSTEVFAIPNVITPNGDGFNDYWNLTGYQNIKEILIFDRFGKKVIILNTDFNWNGKVNGRTLPTATYWYKISLENGQIIEGSLLIKN